MDSSAFRYLGDALAGLFAFAVAAAFIAFFAVIGCIAMGIYIFVH